MRASRILTLSLAVLLASAASLTYTAPAQANDTRVRIYVDLGDVFFDYGRPYYRYDRAPVYVAYDNWGHRRYYRYAPRYVSYGPPAYYGSYGYGYGRRDGRYDRRYDRDHRRNWRDRDDDRGRGHDRRDRRW